MRISRLSRQIVTATLIFAAYLTGPWSISFCSPAAAQSSGYHTELTKPSAIDPAETAQSGWDREVLELSYARLKSGNLSGAEESLARLVDKHPEDGRYLQLLSLIRHQLEAEKWYRYQCRFGLGWAATGK